MLMPSRSAIMLTSYCNGALYFYVAACRTGILHAMLCNMDPFAIS